MTSPAAVLPVADGVKTTVAGPFVMPVMVTSAVGVVVVEQSGVSPTAIISNAESALAAATEGGGGAVGVDHALLAAKLGGVAEAVGA